MNYKIITKEILYKLGIKKKCKCCEYVLSCIQYISENEDVYTPVTKILYVDVAKQFNTSEFCVERGVRSVIDKIWKNKNEEQDGLICKIFGQYNKTNKPTNMQFLSALYDYIRLHTTCKNISLQEDKFIYTCPNTGLTCDYCNDIIIKVIYDITL